VVVGRGHFDYWESGMDMRFGDDMYDSFVRYQGRIIRALDSMAKKHGFEVVDASQSADQIFVELQGRIRKLLAPEPVRARVGPELEVEAGTRRRRVAPEIEVEPGTRRRAAPEIEVEPGTRRRAAPEIEVEPGTRRRAVPEIEVEPGTRKAAPRKKARAAGQS
jgi:hypothetical protein